MRVTTLLLCLAALGCESGTSTVTDAGPAAVASEAMIGPEGATLRTAEGVVVEVPAGAVSTSRRFTVERVATPTLPRGIRVVGEAVRLGPEGVDFARLVRVTLPVPSQEVARAGRGVVLLRRGAPTNEWVAMGSGAPGAASVSAMTSAMSEWALVIVEALDDIGCAIIPGSCAADGGATAFEGHCGMEVRGSRGTVGLSCMLRDIDPSERVVAGYSCTCQGGTGRTFSRPLAELLPAFVDRRFTELAADTLMLCGWPCTTAAPEVDAAVTDVPGADVPGTDVPGTDVPRVDAGAPDVPSSDAGATSGPVVLRAAVDGENTDFSADASVYVLPSDPENISLRGVRAADGTLLSLQTNRLRDGSIGCSTINLNYADGDRFFALGSDGDCVVTQLSVARSVGERAEGTFSGRLRGGGIGDAGTRTISGGFYSFTRE